MQEPKYADVSVTPTQRKILDRLAVGRTNKEISDDVGITHSAVRKQLQLLKKKLHVTKSEYIVCAARREGIL